MKEAGVWVIPDIGVPYVSVQGASTLDLVSGYSQVAPQSFSSMATCVSGSLMHSNPMSLNSPTKARIQPVGTSPRKFVQNFAPEVSRHGPGLLLVSKRLAHGFCQSPGIFQGDEPTRHTILDNFRRAAGARRDHWRSRHCRFQNCHGETFAHFTRHPT